MRPASWPGSEPTRGCYGCRWPAMGTTSRSVPTRPPGLPGSGRATRAERRPGDHTPNERDDATDDRPARVAIHEAVAGEDPEALEHPSETEQDQDRGDDPATPHRYLLDAMLARWTR